MIEQIRQKPRMLVNGFLDFIRERGVVGLAIGFIIGGAVTKLVSSLVGDVVNPVIAVLLGRAADIREVYISVGGAKIMWGNFISNIIDFLIVALVVYAGFKLLGLEKLDKQKEEK